MHTQTAMHMYAYIIAHSLTQSQKSKSLSFIDAQLFLMPDFILRILYVNAAVIVGSRKDTTVHSLKKIIHHLQIIYYRYKLQNFLQSWKSYCILIHQEFIRFY